jgi:hypothetical protein
MQEDVVHIHLGPSKTVHRLIWYLAMATKRQRPSEIGKPRSIVLRLESNKQIYVDVVGCAMTIEIPGDNVGWAGKCESIPLNPMPSAGTLEE